MPTYCFVLEADGRSVEVSCSVADMEAMETGKDRLFFLPEYGFARRDYQREQEGTRSNSAGWPLWSDAAGVHPSQARETMDYLRSRGCPTEINSEGQVRMDNRAHRRDILKALNLHDRNGGYGDG
jgi:hypothetical protein